MEAFCQLRVIDDTGTVFLPIFIFEENLIGIYLYAGNFFIVGHVHEGPIIDLLDALLVIIGLGNGIEDDNYGQGDDIVEQHRSFLFMYFFHNLHSFLSCLIIILKAKR